jgi:hypothetical protein
MEMRKVPVPVAIAALALGVWLSTKEPSPDSAVAVPASVIAPVPPLTEREFAAILSALGLEAEPAGLTSVQFFVGRDGGHLDLPPQAAGNALCSMERHYFLFDDSSGYSRFLEPQYLYWRRVDGRDCVVGSLAQIPNEKTYADPAISIDQLAASIARTEELVALARAFPKCEGLPRFFDIMEKPMYAQRLERSGSPNSEFVATLATAGVYAGAVVTFSLAGNEFVLRGVCAVNWSPFGYEETVSTLTRP